MVRRPVIGLAGVVFSITIVALSLASNQFGPRLLRNFMRDTGNQIVLGTFVATRWNPVIRELYTRLRDRGRPAKAALVAAMRKLLTVLNAILRDQQPWQSA